MWKARFYSALPALLKAHPGARWIFLTLTIRNCPIAQLSAALGQMNRAWDRMRLRVEFAPVLGWIRTTEVTRGRDDDAHPHFHCLLMCPPSMLSGRNYVKQSEWAAIWQSVLRVDYTPIVDVRAIKAKAPRSIADDSSSPPGIPPALMDAITETLKYSIKPADMIGEDDSGRWWFLELTRQVHRKRFVATGGALKNVLRESDESETDLIQGDTEGDSVDDGARLAFDWHAPKKQYRRNRAADKGGM